MPKIGVCMAPLYFGRLLKDSESPLTKIVIPLLTLTAIAKKRRIQKTLD
jgi:hypothetical protein